MPPNNYIKQSEYQRIWRSLLNKRMNRKRASEPLFVDQGPMVICSEHHYLASKRKGLLLDYTNEQSLLLQHCNEGVL